MQTGTITMALTGAGGGCRAGRPGYDAASRTATFTPTRRAGGSTTYTATVSGAKDTAGNTMSHGQLDVHHRGAHQPRGCPCTIWPSTAVPATAADSDTAPVEIGVRFRSDAAGRVTGVRFYKGSGNTGTHVGHLWTRTGTLLGTVTFTGETRQRLAAGHVRHAGRRSAANTTYVVSYYAPVGRYAGDTGYFAAAGVDDGPLHALRNGADGANGVYRYGAGGGFPTSTWQSSNYWVDVVFTHD